MFILYWLGAFYLAVLAGLAIYAGLYITEILPKQKRKWYMLHLLFMVVCITTFAIME